MGLHIPSAVPFVAADRGSTLPLWELLLAAGAGAFVNDDKLVGSNVGNAAYPADRQISRGFGPQAKMQAADVTGIRTGLRQHFLRLVARATADRDPRSDGAAVSGIPTN
jgi:hypothetical protein